MMATNPYFTQYHTQRFSFIGSPQQRDGTYNKDQRFLNMYPELIKSPISDGKKYYLKKRPGVGVANTFTAGQGRGIFYWADQNVFFVVIGNQVYRNNVAIITLTTSVGAVGFTSFRTDSLDLVFLCDGIQAYTVDTLGTVVGISSGTNPNFPNPHRPYPIFLDGYIFLAQNPGGNSQSIQNSNLGDPYTWTSGNFIDAEMYPDEIVALTKAQNYLVAIGSASIEFFYDNANATGSPLQRNAPAVAQMGCPAPGTINQTEKQFILVVSTSAGGRTIWIIDGFQPTEIATEPIREALDLEGIAIANASAFTIQVAGHKFYVLNLTQAQRTFVYDFEEQMWHEWSSGTSQAVFPYSFGTDSNAGFPVLLHNNSGQTVNLSPTIYTDQGNPINCQVTTSKIDFNTIMRKRFYRLSLIGDSPNDGTNTPVNISWSDDDYVTFVGNKTLQMNGSYPSITQLGYSRRRAFQFTYQQPYALRLESFELDIIQEVRR